MNWPEDQLVDLQFDEELEEIYQSGHIADFTEVLYPEVKEILRWLKEQSGSHWHFLRRCTVFHRCWINVTSGIILNP